MQDPSHDAVLLFGGPSRERRVSVASAQHIAGVLRLRRCWFWAPEGRIYEVASESLLAHEGAFERDFAPAPAPARWGSVEGALEALGESVVLIALHGGPGEGGTLQRLLEQRGQPFTGSGSVSSALALDKARAKAAAAAVGVGVSPSVVLTADGRFEAELGRAYRALGPELVLKPLLEGSSFGLRFLSQPSDVVEAARQVRPGEVLLAEQRVVGRELTVGVVQQPDGQLLALPPTEVRLSAGRAFDFAGKYLGQGAQELTPAPVSPELQRASQDVALACHRALGCFGYSRADLMVRGEGAGAGGAGDSRDSLVFLETNTLPGLTAASLVPQQLSCAGIPMRRFLEEQLALARQRAAGSAEP